MIRVLVGDLFIVHRSACGGLLVGHDCWKICCVVLDLLQYMMNVNSNCKESRQGRLMGCAQLVGRKMCLDDDPSYFGLVFRPATTQYHTRVLGHMMNQEDGRWKGNND